MSKQQSIGILEGGVAPNHTLEPSVYQWDFQGPPKDMGPPKMVSGTHTIP